MKKWKDGARFQQMILVLPVKGRSDARPAFGASFFQNLIAFSRSDIVAIEAHARVKQTVSKIIGIVVVSIPPPDAKVESFIVLVGFQVGRHGGCRDLHFRSEVRPDREQGSQQGSIPIL